MKKESSVSLQEHSIELQRLVEIAYPDYTRRQKAEMALDSFITTLGSVRLQLHLLAVDPNDLATAVKAGNSYLQLQQATTNYSKGRAHVIQSMGEDDSEIEELTNINTQQNGQTIAAPGNNVEMALFKMMEVLNMIVGKLKTPKRTFKKTWRPTEQKKQGTVICWGCGEKGHFRTHCQQPTGNATPKSGNDSRPQA
jgi:hypothetical protein